MSGLGVTLRAAMLSPFQIHYIDAQDAHPTRIINVLTATLEQPYSPGSSRCSATVRYRSRT
jgi:hypothetical protein